MGFSRCLRLFFAGVAISSHPMSLNSVANPVPPRPSCQLWTNTIRLLAGMGVIGSSAVGLLAYAGFEWPQARMSLGPW